MHRLGLTMLHSRRGLELAYGGLQRLRQARSTRHLAIFSLGNSEELLCRQADPALGRGRRLWEQGCCYQRGSYTHLQYTKSLSAHESPRLSPFLLERWA